MPPSRRNCRAFISFDYDHDEDLKTLLLGQSRNGKTPFAIEDWSIKEASRRWRSEARERLERANLAVVICGYQTHQATGVSNEIAIAREVGTPFFLLKGRKNGFVRRPAGTTFLWDTLYEWTWENLRKMTERAR